MINLTLQGPFDFQSSDGDLMIEAFQTCLSYLRAGDTGENLDLRITITNRPNMVAAIDVHFGVEKPLRFAYSRHTFEEEGRIAAAEGFLDPRSFVAKILNAREAACAGV